LAKAIKKETETKGGKTPDQINAEKKAKKEEEEKKK
jgi:hypothetical protein